MPVATDGKMKNRVLLKSALLLLLIAADRLVTASEVSFRSNPILGPGSLGLRSEITGIPAEFHLGADGAPKTRLGARLLRNAS